MADTDIDRISGYINNGYKVMIVLRGLPGSGKSTFASKIIKRTFPTYNTNVFVFSTDNYFERIGYKVSLIDEAHKWNQQKVCEQVEAGLSPLIVDNTNLELWEMKPYIQQGVKFGYIIEVLEMKTAWALKPSILANKNIHGVKKEKITRMLEKYQINVNGKDLVDNIFKFKYPQGYIPPCMRTRPPISLDGYYNGTRKHYKKSDDYPNTPPRNDPPPPDEMNKDVDTSTAVIRDFIDFCTTKNQPASSSKIANDSEAYFSDGCVPSTSSANVNRNSTDFNDDAWTDTWTMVENLGRNTHTEPKPQRSLSNKGFTSSANNVNWDTINVQMTFWDSNKPAIDTFVPPAIGFGRDASTSTQGTNELYSEKVCNAQSRDINSSYVPSTSRTIPSKATLDKGITVSEDELIEGDPNLQEFYCIFQDIPRDSIRDLYIKCKGDKNWVGEILLDAKNVPNFINYVNPAQSEHVTQTNQNEECFEDFLNFDQNITNVSNLTLEDNAHKPADLVKINKTSKKDKTQSETALMLKKEIEQNFKYDDSMYSPNNLKVKRRLHGEEDPDNMIDFTCNPEQEPQVTTNIIPQIHINDVPGPSGMNSQPRESDKIVQFNLGGDFLKQLDEFYGTCYSSDQSLQPVINMPTSLLNQIHALWLESICNQKEDANLFMLDEEEFVRQVEQLEQKHASEGTSQNVSNLQEILDMEMALAYYHSDLEQWKQENEEDLATKLTRQKLIEIFPDIEKEALLEVYKAYNNNFEQTLQVLLVSTGKITESQTLEAGHNGLKQLLAQQEQILVEKAKQEKEKVDSIKNQEKIQNFVLKSHDDKKFEGDLTSFVQYHREEANRHLTTRSRYQKKAKEFIDGGNANAANYYHYVATLYSQKYDHSNNIAISGLMQLGSRNNYTLDLHHLYVAEALQVMDVFIDKHIAELRDYSRNNQNVYIITGRGRHSPQNKPRIKPAVIKRLTDRGLPMEEVNPGLLGVNLSSLNRLSCDIDRQP